MNIQQKITLLRLAFYGYFLQDDPAKQNAAESIFALADELHEYVRREIPESDRIWCLSVTSEVKDSAEMLFKNSPVSEMNPELEALLGKLIGVGHIKPKGGN